ncbi:uncharacterized protein LOC113499342 [Trichoplusia ni]|uniref:Uncharacterized protein LOC113499342 n=1 Tax=Trichoplusia ni TaxID=7111 RepID=A0A7E5W4J6_TRINI|nr:uncharacterized protein LOC113499342 [Trichoplusia ni]
MKVSHSFTKLVIKMIILMMLFVLMFMISSFLYSAKYWPDVYNYINANITIKRIPTISELQLTVVDVDYTTEAEVYTTTDQDYMEMTTSEDFDIDEFMKDEFDLKAKTKRNIEIEQFKDYIELPPRGIFVDYVFLEEPIKQNDSKTSEEETDVFDEEESIYKTSVTLLVDDLDGTTLQEVSEDPAVTKKYYTVQDSINKEENREITEEPMTKEIELQVFEHTTTKEGYLVGDDQNCEEEEESVALTTEGMENELVEEEEKIMRDLVDFSKMSTRKSDVEMFTGKPEKFQMMSDPVCEGDPSCKDFSKTVFPWIVSIFITNNSNESQFSYYCDGALLSEKVIITDARCLIIANQTWLPQDVLVFLGKENLQSFGGNEKVHKIKEIMIHPNFTVDSEGIASNALALLITEDTVEFRTNIQSACFHQDWRGNGDEAATTAWGLNGTLLPIIFNKNKDDTCYDRSDEVFCATYGNGVALCPSYGGLYVIRKGYSWCLQGIYHGDPTDRGLCFSKNVLYTALSKHIKWIDDAIDNNKNDIL